MSTTKSKTPTLATVAEHVGVSRMTVSNAFNRPDQLSPALRERILLAAECIGDGRWFVDKAVRYASERVVFGRPIGANQGVQHLDDRRRDVG